MRVLAGLRHPNIVAVYGVCRHADGRVSLVMELAEGGTLSARVAKNKAPLPTREGVRKAPPAPFN